VRAARAAVTDDGEQKSTKADIVADVLRHEIAIGTLPVGADLPSEGRLSERFEVSRPSSREALRNLLLSLKGDGKRVAGYGATSKSTTVLNYCRITKELIPYICDTTPIKQGKVSPGMHIPIKPYEAFTADYPDYAVLFAWNHKNEILAKEQLYAAQGGRWVVFVPKVAVE